MSFVKAVIVGLGKMVLVIAVIPIAVLGLAAELGGDARLSNYITRKMESFVP